MKIYEYTDPGSLITRYRFTDATEPINIANHKLHVSRIAHEVKDSSMYFICDQGKFKIYITRKGNIVVENFDTEMFYRYELFWPADYAYMTGNFASIEMIQGFHRIMVECLDKALDLYESNAAQALVAAERYFAEKVMEVKGYFN